MAAPPSLISAIQAIVSWICHFISFHFWYPNPMAAPSSIISTIQAIVGPDPVFKDPTALKVRIGLRDIKVHLVCCLRNLGDGDEDKYAMMQDLFSTIKAALAGLPFYKNGVLTRNDLQDVNCLAKEVNDKCAWMNIIPDHLTLEDVVQVTDTLLDNIPDFWIATLFMGPDQARTLNNLRDAMDEFGVQARFLRDFLLFAKEGGAQIHQIHYLPLLPFLRSVAWAFRTNLPYPMTDLEWFEEVRSRFPQHSLLIFQFFTQALLSMPRLRRINDSVLKDFLNSLISLSWHLLRYQRHHPRHSVNLKALYERLRLSRFILKQQRQTNSGDFRQQIGVLIHDAGILICSLHLTDVDPKTLLDLLQRFEVVKAHLPLESNSSKANALDFGDSTRRESLRLKLPQFLRANFMRFLVQTASTSTPPDAGFQKDEVTEVLDRLLRGSKQLRLLPITGMTGLGKTTFALKIYNHPTVMHRFQARAWCTVSQVLDKKQVLLQLLQQIQPGDYIKLDEDDLANKLRRSLKGMKYLILLDDVWTPKALESLRSSFPNDATQSRILLTSRLHAIIPDAQHDEQPHFLRLRDDDECLEIMKMKLPHTVGLRTELGIFAKLCKGLPLTAVLVAGLLSAKVQKDWNIILNHLSLGGISSMEQCKIALELSYKHLPDELKLCFLYFGVFQEDELICVRDLIHLWMAEGFVVGKKDLLLEDVAREYLDDLIQRNLVKVFTKRSTGGIRICWVHDLLHDFCLMKGKQLNIFHLLETRDELSDFNEPCNIESRLCIRSSALHFKTSSLFCPLAQSMFLFPLIRDGTGMECLMPDIVFIIQIYKNLRVFYADLKMWCFTPIPSEIELLSRLKFISIRCHQPVIPSSIGNLSNLETLIIELVENDAVSLPHTIWNLQKLKYLRIIASEYRPSCDGFILPHEDLENYPDLLELESICGVQFSSGASMEKQMRKFTNIRSLKCNIVFNWESMNVVVPEFLSKLEFITLCTEPGHQYQFSFGCAENLKKLTLRGFKLSREEIAVVGKLPNLEVLKLLGIVFLEDTLEMEEGEFSNLRILVFGTYNRHHSHCDLETWTAAGDDAVLPCLEKLVFRGCSKLKEIPSSYLGNSSTLEEILVFDCSSALRRFVRNIQEEQNDLGNPIRVQVGSESENDDHDEEEEEGDE